MHPKTLAAAAIAGLAFVSAAQAANLVTNGDFQAGDTGFNSDYTPVAGPGSAIPPAVYAIDTSPANVHPLWSDFGDHTSGDGLMMIVNGSLNAGDWVWQEAGIAVQQDTTYYFSTWIAPSFPASPAQLSFRINGGQVGATFTANAAPGDWRQFYTTWFSGAATTADIGLINQNTAFGGNDFSLDDIVLDTLRPGGLSAVPEPSTWAMMIIGFAGMGAALRNRRGQVLAA